MELGDLNVASLPPQLQNLSCVHIRGNSIRYITFDKNDVGQDSINKLTE
jgi:hypothetical protein